MGHQFADADGVGDTDILGVVLDDRELVLLRLRVRVRDDV